MFWILTPDARRGYGVTYSTPRDKELLSEIARASQMFAALQSAEMPARLQESERSSDTAAVCVDSCGRRCGDVAADDCAGKTSRFFINSSRRWRVRSGLKRLVEGRVTSGDSDRVISNTPCRTREDRRQVSEIIVRAHIQPVLPIDAPPGFVKTRVTLFVDGWNGGSRLIPVEPKRTSDRFRSGV